MNRSTLALLVVCVVLALIIAIELAYPARTADTGVAAAEPALTEAPSFGESVYLPPRMDDLSEMLDRPLFYADRRMPVPPKPAAPAALTPLRMKLEGVAITADSRVAVLRDLKNNQLLQLTEGMSHDGWTLDEVTASGATFQRGAEIEELALETDTGNRRPR
jgi:hypothetical protein